MLEITCPHCQLRKQVNPASVPENTVRATCPRCQRSFALPQTEPLEQPGVACGAASIETIQEPAALVAAEALPKAGFWMRVVAALLDGILVFLLQLVFGLLLAMAGFAASTAGGQEIGGLVTLFGYALSFAYYIVFTGHCGQTPGKMALRIKVIRRDGSEIGYGRAAFREVPGKFVSAILLGIGYLMVAFDEQKQGLHDRIADTYVIKL